MSAELRPNTSNLPPARRPRWRRWGILLLIPFIMLVAWWGWRQWDQAQDEKVLQSTLALWDGEGPWRWNDWLSARPVIADEDNAAVLMTQMFEIVPKNLDTDESHFLFAEETFYPQHRYHAEQARMNRQWLDRCKDTISLFPELMKKKTAVWRYKSQESPLSIPMFSIERTRMLLSVLHLQLEAQVYEGKSALAAETLRNELQLTHHLDYEPSLVSRISQMALLQLVCNDVQRWLAQCEPEEAVLIQLQEDLKQLDEKQSWKRTLRAEAGSLYQTLVEIREGRMDVSQMLGGGSAQSMLGKLRRQVDSYFETRNLLSATQQAECMKIWHDAYLKADQQWSVQRQAWKTAEEEMQQTSTRGLKHLMLPSLYGLVSSEIQLAGKLRATQLALAAECYRREEKRWPESQQPLVGKYLTAFLNDPFNDQPLRMKRVDDGLIIYSIGKNDKDDGGDVLPIKDRPAAPDVGVRLWDVAQRRQPPRLLPQDYLDLMKQQNTDDR